MLFLRNLSGTCARVSSIRSFLPKSRPLARKMHKAYLHHEEGSETFQLCISVKDSSLSVDRQFNFKRQVTESVNSFLGRVNTNLEKVYEKKKKRKQNKAPANEETSSETSVITIDLLSNGSTVPRDTICKDVLFGNNKLLLIVCGTEYEVVVNAPWINVLSLPTSIMAGFPVYPNKLETSFFNRNKSLFSWYRCTKDKQEEWSKVGDDYYYTPTNDDIGCLLKFSCTPGNDSTQGPSFDVVSKNPVQAGPGHCPFETRHLFTGERVNWPRIVSYNILADLYADSETARNQLYPYCPAYAIGIDYRKQLICKELIGYNADILCLQEVDQKVFINDLDPLLSYLDYKAVFSKKGGQVTEGLACFFHSSKFRLVSSHTICLAEELPENPVFIDLWEKLKDNTNLITRFKDRTTSLLVTILQSTSNPDEILLIGNTHLYFHPDADHIRLLQAGMIMLYMEHLRINLSSSMPNSSVSLIMCGDFNSTPDCGVFQLMTTKFVPDDFKDWESNAQEAIKNISLSHSFLLESACGTPEYTNFTVGFVGCLDYIFYQCDSMSVSQVIPFPLEEEVKEHTALPSVLFPSDHIALICDLKLEKVGHKE
ncbi:Protein angel [Gryllus bimaculatus]|nr:Protein angel [Gryllus bimaculatus]